MRVDSIAESKGKVEHLTQLAQVMAGLILLAAMGANGLLGRDRLFTAYLGGFLAVAAILWVAAHAFRESADYTTLYYTLNFALLGVAGLLVERHAGLVLLLTSPLLIAMAWAAWKYAPMPVALEGIGAAWLLWLSLSAICAAGFQGNDFDRSKLAGLGLFWLLQGLVSAIYWTFYEGQPRWANVTTTLAGIGGVLAFAFLIASFTGSGAERLKSGHHGEVEQAAVEAIRLEEAQ